LIGEPARVTLRVRSADQEWIGVGYFGNIAMTHRGGAHQWDPTIDGAQLLPRLSAQVPA